MDGLYDEYDNNKSMFRSDARISHVDQDVQATLSKSKNSYLVLIGSETNKYCFLYQPESYERFV